MYFRMDGVFMKKILKLTWMIALLTAVFWTVSVVRDKQSLQEGLIRLHVVANSDSVEDQTLKLQVRDAVLSYLETAMDTLPSAEEAKAYLQENLHKLECFVNQYLLSQGSAYTASVSLGRETFGVRDYDTFSLPSGVYESLRVTIGEGEGKNWWCVVFPRLCLPAVSQDFEEAAVGAGFSESLVPTLQQDQGYEVRFFLLDVLGRIENFFFRK